MNLREFIKLKRPSLSDSSVITYASILRSLYAKVFQSKDVDVKKFDDTKSILGFLKEVPANRRKTILSALVIITDNAEYRDQMLGDIKTYNNNISTQVKTPEQEASWITMDEVKKVFDQLSKQASVLYKKETLSSADLQEIQNFVIIALLGGMFIPPRRSLDFTNFTIRIDPALNYLDKKTLVFNSYKTAKTYGQQIVECPPALLKILKKWISSNKTDWLLFDSNGGKLTPVKLNERLNKIFGGRKISVNSLRHSYLTGKYADTIKVNEELEKDMTAMGSSKSQSTGYIKKE